MTGGTSIPLLMLVASIAMVIAMFARGGFRDPLPFVAAYFLYFSFGPVVNYLLDRPIYVGISDAYIGMASIGFTLALATMLAVALVRPLRRYPDPKWLQRGGGRDYPLLPPLMLLGTLYAVTVLATRWHLLEGSKLERITAIGHGHNAFLFIETFLCSLFFQAARTAAGRWTYWLNMGGYVAYCLATEERDFIFVAFAILLFRQLYRPGRLPIGLVMGSATLVALATLLFASRSGQAADATQALNQGSVLFVDTFILSHVPEVYPFQHGESLIRALGYLIPHFLYAHPTQLSQWLLSIYAPYSNSGFGFSLTAEAYLNFGFAGIPIFILALAAVHRYLVNRADRADFFLYSGVLFTISWLYSFRGDVAGMLKTVLYGLVFFALLHLTSMRPSTEVKGEGGRRPGRFALRLPGDRPGRHHLGRYGPCPGQPSSRHPARGGERPG